VADSAGASNLFGLSLQGNAAGDPVAAESLNAPTDVSANTTSGFTANVWHHACGVWASATSRVAYLNGGSKGTDTTSCTPTSLDRIGLGNTAQSSPVRLLAGLLAEVGIWNAALTDDEVVALAKGFSPECIRPQNLVFYKKLIRKITDGRGPAITAVGSPTVADHPRIIYPRNRIINPFAVAGAQSINLDLATETDSAPATTARKTVALSLATEADEAPTPTARKTAALSLATETDEAPTLTARKTVTLSLATETDETPTITARKTAALSLATETDEAPVIAPHKAVVLAIAQETDLAIPITTGVGHLVNLELAQETDSAPSVSVFVWTYQGPIKRCESSALRFLEVTMQAVSGTVHARLMDMTNGLPVVESLVSTDAVVKTRLQSPLFNLMVGAEYEVQAGRLEGDSGRLFGVEAVAL